MSSIQRILCPVDFSDPSRVALRYATELSKTLGASLEVMHAFQLPVYALPDGALMATPEMTARISTDLGEALRTLAEEEAPGAETFLVEGAPAAEVARLAEEHDSDLVVMGTHGRTGLRHLLIGSVAERVVRTCPVPVLTVPSPSA
ncbi:MAG: universal stress protein [Sandaracinaceae bacterium]